MTARKTKPRKPRSRIRRGAVHQPQSRPSFPIVGIGASAGGLESLEVFFAHADPEGGMAFVVIQHLDPAHKSIMSSLLKKYTTMEIAEISDGMRVDKNRVYLGPPDYNIGIIDHSLHYVVPEKSHGINLPIDYFFQSLAEDMGEQSIGIILSGTGTDGTLGLKAIKKAGGMAMVQEAEQARYAGMPKSAIDTGLIDFVLPVEKMPQQVLDYAQHPQREGTKVANAATADFQTNLGKILALIRGKTGHDFSLYRNNTIRRRIEQRIALHKMENIADYVRYLERNPKEIESLFKELLINVTRFFRDPDAFAALEKKAIPGILERRKRDTPIRIWIPGCSTGEEAYSLVMLFTEAMGKRKSQFQLLVFASDIDAEAIEIGRRAVYPESISADVSPRRLERFFTRDGNTYRVKKQIRESVIFALQNLTKDPPYSRLDLVSCRNVFIYMEHDLQRKILPIFQYSLVDRGILFLGTSEGIGEFAHSFSAIDTKWKIYKRKGVSHPHPEFPQFPNSLPTVAPGKNLSSAGTGFRMIGEKVIAQHFAPPSVLVNETLDILYSYGLIDRYLAITTGEASLNLLHIAREGLRHKLESTISQALREKTRVICKNVHVKSDGRVRNIDLIAQPIIEPGDTQQMMLVVFKEKAESEAPAQKAKKTGKAPPRNVEMKALELELKTTKEYLQNTIADLQTTNEEFQSTNEELQSTNEEVETSKEELQSTNEELVTVNTEMQHKVEQLTETSNDVNNLLAGTDIASLFLDTDLRIKRFTPAMAKIFRLLDTDSGRSIRDITSTIVSFNIYDAAGEVLASLTRKEVEVRNENDCWFSLRILPYRTMDNTIDGVVITLSDISDLKHTLRELEEAKLLAESIVETIREPFLVLDHELSVRSANSSFYAQFKVTPTETVNRRVYDLGDGQWEIPQLRKLLEEVIPADAKIVDFHVEHEFPGLGKRMMMLNANLIPQTKFILLAIEDITESAAHSKKME